MLVNLAPQLDQSAALPAQLDMNRLLLEQRHAPLVNLDTQQQAPEAPLVLHVRLEHTPQRSAQLNA